MAQTQYWLVVGNDLQQKITDGYTRRSEVAKNRRALVRELFPKLKADVFTWSGAFSGTESRISFRLSREDMDRLVKDKSGPWKYDKQQSTILPRGSTKAGKELEKKLSDTKYLNQSACGITGVEPEFVSDQGLSMVGIGLHPFEQADGSFRYVIEAYKAHKLPLDQLKRISDVELEEMRTATAKKPKKKLKEPTK